MSIGKYLGVLVLGVFLSGQAPLVLGLSSSVNPGSGLRFVPPEELRGIPLAELPYAGFELPASVDLSEHMPPPGHQAQQNSCAAWASAYAVKTYQEKVEQRYLLVDKGEPRWSRIFSPAFVYNQINQGRDGGATLVDALNLLRAKGALSWADMPYLADNITQYPSAQQLQKARRFRIAYWRQVNVADIMEIKSHVHAGYPVMTGMLIDQGFYHLKKIPWRAFDGTPKTGHALVIVGFDDSKRAFKVMNSWGKDWSEDGYGWVTYRHFRKAAREAYVAKDAWNEPPLPVVARESKQRDRSDDFGVASPASPAVVAKPAPMDAPKASLQKRDKSEVPEAAEAVNDLVSEKDHDALVEHGVWSEIQSQRIGGQWHFSGSVTFLHAFSNPEVVLRFYAVEDQREAIKPFYGVAAAGGRFQLPNGQLALKARLAEPTETGQGLSYAWEASLPLAALGVTQSSSPKLSDLRVQPVFYTDKFGVSKGALMPAFNSD